MKKEFAGTFGLLLVPLLVALIAGPGAMAAELRYRLHDTFGDSGRGRNELDTPVSIAVSGQDTFAVLDRARNTVVLYDRRGDWQKSLGEPKGTGPVSLRRPSGVAFDDAGRIWVADTDNDRVLAVNPNGVVLVTLGRYGIMKGEFKKPVDVAMGPGGRIYVADYGNDRVQLFANSGKLLDMWYDRSPKSAKAFRKPRALAYSSEGDGYLWVACEGSPVLGKIDQNGDKVGEIDLSKLVEGDVSVSRLYADPGFDRLFVCDTAGNRILVVGNGRLISRINMEPGTRAAGMAVAWGLNVFVIDAEGRRVMEYVRE